MPRHKFTSRSCKNAQNKRLAIRMSREEFFAKLGMMNYYIEQELIYRKTNNIIGD